MGTVPPCGTVLIGGMLGDLTSIPCGTVLAVVTSCGTVLIGGMLDDLTTM